MFALWQELKYYLFMVNLMLTDNGPLQVGQLQTYEKPEVGTTCTGQVFSH